MARSRAFKGGPRRALVIGASAGYGLATRIAAAFGCGASTLGVSLEKPPTEASCATAGYYNTAWFDKLAGEAGLQYLSLSGDAFSDEVKREVIRTGAALGPFDLVVYSLAAPRRVDPDTGDKYQSVIKPMGQAFSERNVNVDTGEVKEVTIEPGTEEEAAATVKVMGGEDWERWIRCLCDAGMLAQGVKTVAYSYIGPEITHPIYANGTIGRAKDHLLRTAECLRGYLATLSGDARVSVNKALVTQSSSAIPIVPLYISILYQVMKETNLHEGCIEQATCLLERLYHRPGMVDELGRVRMDDWEMRSDIQEEVMRRWRGVNSDNLNELTDIAGYRAEFLKLFGFRDDVDTDVDVDPMI